MRRTSRRPWTRPLQAERRSAFVKAPVGDADDGSLASVRAMSAPRRRWSYVDRGKSGRGATGADDRLRTLRPNRHAGRFAAVAGGAAIGWSSDSSATCTLDGYTDGQITVEDHLCERRSPVDGGAAGIFSATAQTAGPGAKAPSAAWSGIRSAIAPANRGRRGGKCGADCYPPNPPVDVQPGVVRRATIRPPLPAVDALDASAKVLPLSGFACRLLSRFRARRAGKRWLGRWRLASRESR